MWLNNKKERLQMLQQIQFTSKAALKQQSIFIANGNPKEAKELYDFLIEGMETLPDVDPTPTTWQENTKETLSGAFNWVKDNKDTIVQGIDLLRGLFGKGPITSTTPATPLPAINEG